MCTCKWCQDTGPATFRSMDYWEAVSNSAYRVVGAIYREMETPNYRVLEQVVRNMTDDEIKQKLAEVGGLAIDHCLPHNISAVRQRAVYDD